jgi:hypothetical protein
LLCIEKEYKINEGKIDNELIVRELSDSYTKEFIELCLSAIVNQNNELDFNKISIFYANNVFEEYGKVLDKDIFIKHWFKVLDNFKFSYSKLNVLKILKVSSM